MERHFCISAYLLFPCPTISSQGVRAPYNPPMTPWLQDYSCFPAASIVQVAATSFLPVSSPQALFLLPVPACHGPPRSALLGASDCWCQAGRWNAMSWVGKSLHQGGVGESMERTEWGTAFPLPHVDS